MAESSCTCGENTLARRAVKSPRCMPEANIILCVNYTHMEKKKKKKAGQGCGLEASRIVASEAHSLAQSQGWQSQKWHLREINRCVCPLPPLTWIKHVIIYLTKLTSDFNFKMAPDFIICGLCLCSIWILYLYESYLKCTRLSTCDKIFHVNNLSSYCLICFVYRFILLYLFCI